MANSRYLDALAVVDDPTHAKRDLDCVTTPQKDATSRECSGFNAVSRHDAESFKAVMDGDHRLRGFTNLDIRTKLQLTPHVPICGQDRKKQISKVRPDLSAVARTRA